MTRKLFVALATVGLLWAAPQAGAQEKQNASTDTYRYLELFGDVFERVRSQYVEEVTDEDLIRAAITGMLTDLDPHSSYLPPKNFQEMQVQTRGEFGGLGIQVTMDNGMVKVISPIDDTPAFHAGIEAGDIISHLDGEPVAGMNLSEAVEKMRGPVGTDISLTVHRKGKEPFDVTITRAVVKIESVRSRLEGNVGYVRITSFNERTESGITKALEGFFAEKGDNLQGVVLDLRNNPGGLLDQAIAVSDTFLDSGEVVSTRSRHAAETQRYNANPGDLARGLPVVVLINGGSASASEIVAGALQDHHRALVMGTKSFGKGSVQTIIPLSGHGAMRLTTARYYTPSGRSIQAVGIEPDITVEAARIEPIEQPDGMRREADLRGALSNGGENGRTEEPDAQDGAEPETDQPAAEDGEPERPGQHDYQLQRALDLIRGMVLFNTQIGPQAAAR